VPSIVSKTSLASAAMPAGPLTLASSPPGAPSTDLAVGLDRVEDVLVLAGHLDPVLDERRGAVARDDRRPERRRVVKRTRRAVELGDVGRDRRAVGRRQPAVAPVDDDRRRHVAVVEPLGDAERLGGLGARRQIVDVLVLLGVREPARQVEREAPEEDREPDTGDDPFRLPGRGDGEET